MTDFSISAKDRLLIAIKEREEYITIPKRGSKILYFKHRLNSEQGIDIIVDIDDRSRGRRTMEDMKRNLHRKITVPFIRIDIGKHPDVRNGGIVRITPPDQRITLEDTLNFVNLYLGYNIHVEDVNRHFFNTKTKMLTIRILQTSLKYFGELKIYMT